MLVATHLDKECIHNHFVVNSVSFVDGKKYNDCKQSYRALRDASDKLCAEYALSITAPGPSSAKHYSEWKAEKEGKPTYRSLIKEDVDQIISSVFTFRQFTEELRSMLLTNVFEY